MEEHIRHAPQNNGHDPEAPRDGGEPAGIADTSLRPLEKIPTFLQPPISLRARLCHFTFAWYTLTMSTGGIALVLALTPHRFTGLNIIGLVVFLVDAVFFCFITTCLCLRFALFRKTFRKAFTHPSEALFVPTFFLSIAALLCNTCEYGTIFLNEDSQVGLFAFLRVMFWFYLALTFLVSILQYHQLFSVKEQRRLTISSMTPAWILPIFPTMLAGTLAATIAPTQSPNEALGMISAGLAAQGLGMLISIFMYSTYLSRLMAFGLPAQRPGMFIAVGPPSFTCAAVVSMASDVPRIFAGSTTPLVQGLASPAILADGVRLTALSFATFLWGLSFWFFTAAVVGVVSGMPDRKFHLSWWSFVFPNVGFTVACIRIGLAFGSEGVLWLSTVMSIVLVVVWAFLVWRCTRAVIKREIVWPGHDEDSG